MTFQTISIIGAGLSGLSLALFLKQNQGDLSVTIYELRRPDTTSGGAIMLSPNALRTLDALGLYERIRSKGFGFRTLHFNDNDHRSIDEYEMGNADVYGYDALRVYRQVILDEAKAMVHAAGIEVVYGKKFSHVVSEDENGVRFAFVDGEEKSTDLLIGADGIHSTVRKYLAPDVVPAFSNFMAVTGSIRTEEVRFPFGSYPMPVGIHGSAGAFVLAPQNPERSECLVGTQLRTRERDRAGWDALWKDKEQLLELVRENYDSWNPMVQSAIDAIPPETMSIWPFYTVPKMEKWSSTKGKVVMLGDSAHAIPPAAGQGVNQAFEDVHSLSLLVSAANEGKAVFTEALKWWQEYRQARINGVDILTDEMNKRRIPGWNGEGAQRIDCSWLFSVNIVADVLAWLATKQK